MPANGGKIRFKDVSVFIDKDGHVERYLYTDLRQKSAAACLSG